MLKKTILSASITCALAASLPADAAPFGVYDPRSLGMGGVGVTTATARNAGYFNPAALAATKEDEDFALNLTAALHAVDRDKLADDIDDLESSGNQLDQEIARFSATPTPANAGTLGAAVANFDSILNKVDNKSLDGSAFAGVILAVPSKKIGIGLHALGRADFGARLDYQDAGFFGPLAIELTNCGGGDAAQCTAADSRISAKQDANGELQLDSRLEVRGLLVTEVGLALARRFNDWGGIDIGVTPKIQKVKTFNQSISAQNSEIDFDRNTVEDSAFNLDVGVTKAYGENYKAGLVVKNLLAKEYALSGSTEKIKLEPQARLGLSHHTSWTVVGLDVDLTKNKGLAGFSKDTQFASIGAELDVWLLQLRVGYRHDLAGNYDGIPSVGLGLNLFGLHLDAAVAGNDKEMAASVQLGLNF